MTLPHYRRLCLAAAAFAVALAWAAPAAAQVEPCPAPMKDGKPNLPPANSPTLVRCIQLYAHPINETIIDQETYSYYIKTKVSEPSKDSWVPYDPEGPNADFYGLWRTNFLDNLWVEIIDEPYANGVPAKHIVYHIEERSRVKAVDYSPKEGTKTTVDISKIEEKLRERDVHLALDSFVDEATIRKVKGVIREIYSDKGYNDVGIETELKPMTTGPKLVHLNFIIDQGPKYKLADVIFDGNKAFSDATLRSHMKDNKPKAWWSFFTSGGTYHDAKFADDASLVNEFYLDQGYVRAIVGQQTVETVSDSKDGKLRYIRLRVPVEEGQRYKVGSLTIADNTALKPEPLRAMFKLQEGDYYSHAKILKGLDKAREIYGQLGYYQFVAEPEPKLRGIDPETGNPIGPEPPPPIVDVVIKMNEGKRYYVNRITFTGNSTTHDAVARRELRLYEEGVFDTQALKESIRRLNQLGYFKPLEGKDGEVDISPTPGRDGLVDIKLKFEEQNRNQISFGAGVSQYDGFFGQLSYQTANFLGRGETFGVNLQKGTRARQYQVSFTEPYLFDRPLTAGIELFARQFAYPYQVHAGFDRRHRHGRLPDLEEHAPLRRLRLREVARLRHQPDLSDRGRPGESDPAGIAAARAGRPPHRQQDHAVGRLQHGQPAAVPDRRQAVHRVDGTGGAGRGYLLHQAARRGHLLHSVHEETVARPARRRAVDRAAGEFVRAAHLREVLPRRRVLGPRIRHAHHQSARLGHGHRDRRQQDARVQRRALLQHRRPGPRAGLLRCRPGARCGRIVRLVAGDRHAGAVRSRAVVRPLHERDPDRRNRTCPPTRRSRGRMRSRCRPVGKSASSCRS